MCITDVDNNISTPISIEYDWFSQTTNKDGDMNRPLSPSLYIRQDCFLKKVDDYSDDEFSDFKSNDNLHREDSENDYTPDYNKHGLHCEDGKDECMQDYDKHSYEECDVEHPFSSLLAVLTPNDPLLQIANIDEDLEISTIWKNISNHVITEALPFDFLELEEKSTSSVVQFCNPSVSRSISNQK